MLSVYCFYYMFGTTVELIGRPSRIYLVGFAGPVAQHSDLVDARVRQSLNGRLYFGQVDSMPSDLDLRVGSALVQQHAVDHFTVVSGSVHPVHA